MMKLETLLIHSGAEIDPATGAVAPPIHLSTTFEHGPESELLKGYMYVRESNPTQTRLEEALASIEGGEVALVFGSGLAAGAAYLQSLPEGSHVLVHKDIYFDFQTIMREFFPRWGINCIAVDMKELKNVQDNLRSNTKVIWMETPSNPLMEIIDICSLAEISRQAGAKLVVDGTFATPFLQQPLKLGTDVVLHSTTKYLGGHSDVQGGALVFKTLDESFEQIQHIRKVLGGVGSPFNSWLVLRGIRSLACRMERHSSNALGIARRLEEHPSVERVHYPGLPSHPGYEIAKKQMRAKEDHYLELVALLTKASVGN